MRSCAVCAVVCIARVCRRSRRDQAREPRNAQQYGRKDVLLLDQGYNGADTDRDARNVLADALEQLGYGAENGTWRNVFLAGATELRQGSFGTPVSAGADVVRSLTVSQLLDSVAIRIDGPRAWQTSLRIALTIADDGVTYLAELRNGALHHRRVDAAPAGVTVFTLSRLALIGLVTGALDLAAALADGTVTVEGDSGVLGQLVSLLGPTDPGFAIVTP